MNLFSGGLCSFKRGYEAKDGLQRPETAKKERERDRKTGGEMKRGEDKRWHRWEERERESRCSKRTMEEEKRET